MHCSFSDSLQVQINCDSVDRGQELEGFHGIWTFLSYLLALEIKFKHSPVSRMKCYIMLQIQYVTSVGFIHITSTFVHKCRTMLRLYVFMLNFSSGDEKAGSDVTSGGHVGHAAPHTADIFKMSVEPLFPAAFVATKGMVDIYFFYFI